MWLACPHAPPHAPNANDPEVETAFAACPDTVVARDPRRSVAHDVPVPPAARTRVDATCGSTPSLEDDPGEPGGWGLLVEPEIRLGPKPHKVVPDLAGWRRERLPASVFDNDAPGALSIEPDWVCEVLSKQTERLDRGSKMRISRREGVRRVWLLSPTLETLEVYRLDAGTWTLLEMFEGDAVVRAEPFDAIELPLSGVWAR